MIPTFAEFNPEWRRSTVSPDLTHGVVADRKTALSVGHPFVFWRPPVLCTHLSD